MTQETAIQRSVPWPIRAAVGLPLGILAIGTAGLAKIMDETTEALVGDLL